MRIARSSFEPLRVTAQRRQVPLDDGERDHHVVGGVGHIAGERFVSPRERVHLFSEAGARVLEGTREHGELIGSVLRHALRILPYGAGQATHAAHDGPGREQGHEHRPQSGEQRGDDHAHADRRLGSGDHDDAAGTRPRHPPGDQTPTRPPASDGRRQLRAVLELETQLFLERATSTRRPELVVVDPGTSSSASVAHARKLLAAIPHRLETLGARLSHLFDEERPTPGVERPHKPQRDGHHGEQEGQPEPRAQLHERRLKRDARRACSRCPRRSALGRRRLRASCAGATRGRRGRARSPRRGPRWRARRG